MMNPFIAWAVSWQGTAALMLCALAFGVIVGWTSGKPAGRRQAVRWMRERREEARAVRQFRELRQDGPARQWLAGLPRVGATTDPPEVAHEWEPAHVAAALALASDDPTVSAWTADMAASMDRWLAEHVYGVPYSADELWSGQ